MYCTCIKSTRKFLIRFISFADRPKRILVIINPNSGRKRGIKIYQKIASPLFKLCDVKTDVIGKFLIHSYNLDNIHNNLDNIIIHYT